MKKHVLMVTALFLAACSEPTSTSSVVHTADPAIRSIVTPVTPTAVLPSAYTAVMGPTNNNFPHASFRQMRYQQVFLGSDLVNPAIVSLCLRRDELPTASLARTKTLTIKLGPTSLDYSNLGATFDDNYSALPTTVFSGDVTIPASPGSGTPADFDFCIPFTQEYDHPGGNLIVEVVNTSLDLHDAPRDACDVSEVACTTARAYAFSPTATTATTIDRTGLIMKLVSPTPPAPVDPVTHEDCYLGGWSDFGFKNQGQCVRLVETGKDSRIGQ